MKLEFFWQFFENIQMSNFMKIRPVGAELFHGDRRTDRHDEANSRFSQFFESAKKRTKAIPLQLTSKCNVAKMCTLHGDKLRFFLFSNIFKHIIL